MNMNMERIFEKLQQGELSMEQAKQAAIAEIDELQKGSVDISFANLDIQRERRIGFPEVIYGEGKTAEQIAEIVKRLQSHSDRILATRIEANKAEKIQSLLPDIDLHYHADARSITWLRKPIDKKENGYIAVVCAGTSDIPVAEEAAITAEMMGNHVLRINDVGVAGIHRLFARLEDIRKANVVVVAAGMEGALTSVVGGLVDVPVIAVPTSVGYGAHYDGLAALLSMLNACAPGITVVNIDNGFGAGYAAGLINERMYKEET
ncbi:nickel pincer cofactor biosynthesis protein LarB [Marinicrinis lubricantis]|uniref:Nickel pincer cofactor biosynthesis protein LarB n=1 Tax=Marinicrinis lubricantis TaxID=2086470 RepID=A0ABW1IPU0_9BACL